MIRKQLGNSILIWILFIMLSCIFSSPILATNTDIPTSDININEIETNSSACLLMDAKTGKIIYSKNAYEKMYPASTTKLMTAILVLENCNLTDIATVSHNAIYSVPVGYSHASLKEGEELTIEQLLNVLLIPSANDAAIVLAEHVSGSVEEFANLMNNKAEELGCKNTHFVNPNGIHDKNHYSTAYDLALIGRYAMKFDNIMRIAMVKQYTLPTTNKYDKTDRIFNATNSLINNESLNKNYYEYATGLKTGYTDYSGYCIVSTAKKDDMELIAVVLKGNSIDERYSDCKALFNYGFDNYSYTTINSANDIIKQIEISNGTSETKNLDVAVKDDIQVLLKNGTDIANLDPLIDINSDLKAPLAENTIIGKVTYTIDGEEYSSDLIAANAVYPSSFEVIVLRVLLIFLIFYIIYRLLKRDSNGKTKRNITYSSKENKRKSVKRHKRKYFKFKINNNSSNPHKGKGDFKFTQISNYYNF